MLVFRNIFLHNKLTFMNDTKSQYQINDNSSLINSVLFNNIRKFFFKNFTNIQKVVSDSNPPTLISLGQLSKLTSDLRYNEVVVNFEVKTNRVCRVIKQLKKYYYYPIVFVSLQDTCIFIDF